MGVRVGIDTGGTFTDVVAVDEDTGALTTTKTPSTPADPSRGFLAGVDKVLAMLGDDGGAVTGIAHGTTVATNALLEDRITDLGFVTTTGYRYVLEIARQSVPDGYGNSYFWVKPDRLVPVDRVLEVGGRLDHSGAELASFDEAAAVAAARWLREHGITTVGVCFLHAYANPDHERRMRDVLAREHPDAVVSISSDVLREYREYERSITTLVDAAVKPTVTGYLQAIAARLSAFMGPEEARDPGSRSGSGSSRGAEPPVPFTVMKSNGGVLSAAEVVHQPITTVLSGPAAGALGAATIARAAGFERLLTLDGGGTSTDVSVVLGGEPTLTTEGSVGRFPSKIPMIDIATVGAGGGSVAWIAPEGNLKVGPRSAGADPGPCCYGQGGTEPTVTDAHVALGRLPAHLLGGEIPLDVDAGRTAIARLGDDLGLGVEDAALGVLEISAWNQANAIRRVTVRRGLDVRDFALAAFGGSGPLLVCRLMDVLGVPTVVVPPNPGNLSAFGLLTVDVKDDHVRTHVVGHDAIDHDRLAAVFDELESDAGAALDREGFAAGQHRLVRSADLRYAGQAFEVRVAMGDGPVDADLTDAVGDAFHTAHEQLYGYCYRPGTSADATTRHPVEWVNLRVTGIGPIRRPTLTRAASAAEATPEPAGTRPVCFSAAGEGTPHWTSTPIHAREHLRAGQVVAGPAVIEEFGSTLPVHPGFAARVDELANLVVTRTDKTDPTTPPSPVLEPHTDRLAPPSARGEP